MELSKKQLPQQEDKFSARAKEIQEDVRKMAVELHELEVQLIREELASSANPPA